MRRLQFLFICILGLSLAGCSVFGGGKKEGDGSMGDGNIPIASPGGELADVNFAFDSSELNGGAQSVLGTNSQWLLDNPGKKVVIEGHCDERGTAEYNLALGERRARSVEQYLRSLGVASGQMSTISYGEELPLDPANSEGAWAKNRRAHFAIRR